MPESQPQLPCPNCGYNVIGQVLAGSRVCPECGCELPPVRPEPADTLALRWQAACPPKPPTALIMCTLAFSVLAPSAIVFAGAMLNVYLAGRNARLISFRLILIAAAAIGVISLLSLPIRLKRDLPLIMLLTPLIVLAIGLIALVLAWGLLGIT